MSIETTIVCVDCRVAAPAIGDVGFIGWPSLSERREPPTDEKWDFLEFPFGYLRRTFLDMGISTDELEEFAKFLHQHDGHNLDAAPEGGGLLEDFKGARARRFRPSASGVFVKRIASSHNDRTLDAPWFVGSAALMAAAALCLTSIVSVRGETAECAMVAGRVESESAAAASRRTR